MVYVSFLARHIKYSSIKTYLAGIQYHAITRGFTTSICSMQKLHYVLRGIRRHHAVIFHITPKLPISITHLSILFDFTDRHYHRQDASMLQTAMSFAFFGMLRSAEYCVSRTSVFVPADSMLVSDVSQVHDLLSICIKSSKTDPFRKGYVLRLASIVSRFCPVRAFNKFLQFRLPASYPLFRFRDGSFLTRQRLSALIHSCFPRSNLNTHSFRIGGASAAAAAGIADSSIQILGRWSSDAFLRYLRFSSEDISRFHCRMSSSHSF